MLSFVCFYCFFFFKQKTAYEMRISDWSSDVCSSDLDLNRRLREIEAAPSTSAGVGLFFGGRPVVGSYGIQAEFGAKAVAEFQTLVSNTFAAAEGTLGARGPVPQRARTQLMLPDLARGSFGFLLSKSDDTALFASEKNRGLDRH